jgi:hypothetical protein
MGDWAGGRTMGAHARDCSDADHWRGSGGGRRGEKSMEKPPSCEIALNTRWQWRVCLAPRTVCGLDGGAIVRTYNRRAPNLPEAGAG